MRHRFVLSAGVRRYLTLSQRAKRATIYLEMDHCQIDSQTHCVALFCGLLALCCSPVGELGQVGRYTRRTGVLFALHDDYRSTKTSLEFSGCRRRRRRRRRRRSDDRRAETGRGKKEKRLSRARALCQDHSTPVLCLYASRLRFETKLSMAPSVLVFENFALTPTLSSSTNLFAGAATQAKRQHRLC